MTKAPTSNMDVKRRNRASTLRCALECGRVSQQELSRRLELSWPTILQNVKELAALGLLREDGVYDSTGGRKARAYVPVPEGRVAVVTGAGRLRGADLHGTDLRGAAALVVAALGAKGVSRISGLPHLARGYEGLDDALRSRGARIETI